jgi:hypothetical protein
MAFQLKGRAVGGPADADVLEQVGDEKGLVGVLRDYPTSGPAPGDADGFAGTNVRAGRQGHDHGGEVIGRQIAKVGKGLNVRRGGHDFKNPARDVGQGRGLRRKNWWR